MSVLQERHLNGNQVAQLLNFLMHLVAGNPGSPTNGQFWYNTSTDKVMWRAGGVSIDPLARANHSGTQIASSISDFDTQVRTSRLDQMAPPTADVPLNARKITGLADPTVAQDAATKAYTDATSAGRDWKDTVRLATAAALPANTRTGNVLTASANGALTVDGVAVANGDRVLVKDEVTGANNGLYVVTDLGSGGTPFVLTRSSDADTSAEVTPGATVSVEEGTANADKRYLLTTNAPITLNTTALTFTADAGESITAGAGLTKTGSTLDVGAGTGVVANANDVAIDPAVVVRKAWADCAGALTTTVTHNFGTRDIDVVVVRDVSPWDKIDTEWEATDANNALVRFLTAPGAGDFRIGVFG